MVEPLAEQLGIAPQHRRLLGRFLAILEEDGLLLRTQTGWEVICPPADTNPDRTWRELVGAYPAFIAEMILLGRCGQQLPQVLRDQVKPLQLIFPEGALTTAEHLYQDSPSQRYYNSVTQHALASLLASFPEDRPLRILEIGAGTGGLTAYVLPLLPAGRTEYVFTDLSNHFFNKAEQKFRDFPFVQYKHLDIEVDPIEQGYREQSFDLILASQVLHATTDLRHTLSNVRRLLAPAGLLLLLEAVRPPRWFDLVFGLTEGWWRFTDLDLRPAHPGLSFATWERVLEEAGFAETTDLCLPRGEQAFESAVILTQGPDTEASLAVGKNTAKMAVAPSSRGFDEHATAKMAVAQNASEKPECATAVPAVLAGSQGSWLIFADRGGVGDKLAELLVARGEHCTVVLAGEMFAQRGADRFEIPPTRESMRQLLEQVLPAQQLPWRGVLHLWNLDAPAADSFSTALLESAQEAGCLSVAHLLQSWMELESKESPRLWLITAGAHAVTGQEEPIAVAQTPLWGLGRVAANEFQQFHCKIVDLSLRPSQAEVASLCEELFSDNREDEVALRGEGRYVHRYMRRPLDQQTSQSGDSSATAYRLEVSRSGTIDGLRLRTVPRRSPGAGEIEVQICAAALNFSDVLKALGLYPGLPEGPVPLGIECSGRVVAVGSGVEDFRSGDEVIAIAPFSFSSFLTLPAQTVAHKPAHLSFEEAATIPIAFLTAEYALNYMGRLTEGERVLIHSATGGVGLAAFQLARKAGAEIFATAGNPEKREFLQALGIKHVMDSRSLAFADGVMERTGGRGVDLVLNSLSGEAIAKGLASLADHGRFLEIGKRDIYQNSRLGLAPFRKNLSLIAIDLDRALRERPTQIASMFRSLVREVEQRKLAPLPYRVFPLANIAGAFRHLAQGKHLGKVVVSLQDQIGAAVFRAEAAPTFHADATYLITGGLGGFGLAVARWLIAHGARHLVLASRRGVATPEARQAVEGLEQAGARVLVTQTDVSRTEQTSALLDEIGRTMPPLRGIFHAAMVLDDCLLLNLNNERLQKVLGPKMSGAWNLHTQTLGLPLDCFVLFSTMSCVFGLPGQGNYSAANTFLDALAHHRRALGLPALTINWGYLGEVGYVARNEKVGQGFEQAGVSSFTPEEALTVLGRLLQQDSSQVGVIRVNWSRQKVMFGTAPVPPRFSHLYEQSASEAAVEVEGVPIRQAVLAALPDQRKGLLQALLRDKVAAVLGTPAARLDLDKPLAEVGLDSLMAVELGNWIESELRLSLPMAELMRGPSVTRLADVLLEQLCQSEGGAPAQTSGESVRDAAPARREPPVEANGERQPSVGPTPSQPELTNGTVEKPATRELTPAARRRFRFPTVSGPCGSCSN